MSDFAYDPRPGAAPAPNFAPAPSGQVLGYPLASWGIRVGAALIDYVASYAVLLLCDAVGLTDFGLVLSLVVLILNAGIMQGLTGQSIGKRVLNLRTVVWVQPSLGQNVLAVPGIGTCIVRLVAHLLDTILLIGYLMPLVTAKKRTFADMVVSTYVIRGAGYVVQRASGPRQS